MTQRAMNSALITGTLVGTLTAATKYPHHPLSEAQVTAIVDGDGNYTQRIEVTTFNGVTYTIAVIDAYTIFEEAL